MTLHDLPKNERPRERLLKYGISNLSSQELLALILGRGIKGEPVMATAQKLLSTFGSLKKIMHTNNEDLQHIRGIGFAKACQIQACFELAKRAQVPDETYKKLVKITKPETIFLMMKDELTTYKKEYFIVISLDTRNNIIATDTVSIGTLNASLVHPREVFDCAVYRNAAQIILVHNHPSGEPEPSDDDIKITNRLISAGRIMGIEVLDHIIIAKESFISFKEKKLI